MGNPTRIRRRRKAAKFSKPHPDFPLFPHASGRWAKKIRGQFAYFGKVAADPKGDKALELWLAQKDDLLAGRKPRVGREGLTIRDLLNRFLNAKLRLVESGEIVRRTFNNYVKTGERIVACFGRTRLVDDLDAEDFGKLRVQLAAQYGPTALSVEIQKVRVIFGYAYASRLIKAPVPYGPDFRRPGKRVMRQAKAAKGLRMFEAAELRKILDAVTVPLKAMTLLGVNCGLGNHDCGQLPMSAVNLDTGWLDYPRGKTGIERRCPLWPETIEALRLAIAKRPKPIDQADKDLVFITHRGQRWVRMRSSEVPDEDGKPRRKDAWIDSIGYEFQKWLNKLGLKRPGLAFYALRHTTETIGGDSRDQVAVDYIMGHSRGDMASVYRERISDDRLRAVVEHVRGWLFGGNKKK